MIAVVLLACGSKPSRGEWKSKADDRYPAPPALVGAARQAVVATDADDGVFEAGVSVGEVPGERNVASGARTVRLGFALAEGPPPAWARLLLPVEPRPGGGPLEVTIGLVGGSERVTWKVADGWPDPWAAMPKKASRATAVCAPFERATPDLAPLFAAGLPARAELELTAVVGELVVLDSQETADSECAGRLSPIFEWAPTVREALAAKPMIGRVTDTSAALTLLSWIDLEVALVVNGEPLPPGAARAGVGTTFAVPGLLPDQENTVSPRVRRPGEPEWTELEPLVFRTRRPPGAPFRFAVTADCHFLNMEHRRAWSSMHLFQRTMSRLGEEKPDFLLDLGDSFNSESYRSWDAPDREEALRRHLGVRPYFDLAAAPLYAVLGNHEGEQGWRRDGLPIRAEAARNEVYPNPWTADADGRPHDWFSFTWGDVLVVVLDPYAHTKRKPHDLDGAEGSGDRWDWSLGQAQYDWLVATLEGSDAPWKLVFSHQVTGGTNDYGRGGRLAAMHSPPKAKGSYEWGGRNKNGTPGFEEHRPGWARPVHQVLADTDVAAFIHGHDHVFAFEPPLDGVGYVTVPQPGDAQYDAGHAPRSGIDPDATVIENSGYVRFDVAPGRLELAYVRAFLPGDGEDGSVAFSYTFTDCDGNRVPDLQDAAAGRTVTCQ